MSPCRQAKNTLHYEPNRLEECCVDRLSRQDLSGSSATTGEIRNQLLQLRVLCLGLFQDGNVRVGILPERKEVMIFRAGLGGVAL